MQSRADGEGKCFTIEGGYDMFLFGVAAGKGIYVGGLDSREAWLSSPTNYMYSTIRLWKDYLSSFPIIQTVIIITW